MLDLNARFLWEEILCRKLNEPAPLPRNIKRPPANKDDALLFRLYPDATHLIRLATFVDDKYPVINAAKKNEKLMVLTLFRSKHGYITIDDEEKHDLILHAIRADVALHFCPSLGCLKERPPKDGNLEFYG